MPLKRNAVASTDSTDPNANNRFISDPVLYKTKVCRNFMRDSFCYYESKCMFAHGNFDLRSQEQNKSDKLDTEEDVKRFQTKTIMALKQKSRKEAPPTFEVALQQTIENKTIINNKLTSPQPSTESSDEASAPNTQVAQSPATPQTTTRPQAPPIAAAPKLPAGRRVNNSAYQQRPYKPYNAQQQQLPAPTPAAAAAAAAAAPNYSTPLFDVYDDATPVKVGTYTTTNTGSSKKSSSMTHNPYLVMNDSITSIGGASTMTYNDSTSSFGYEYFNGSYSQYGYGPMNSYGHGYGHGYCDCESCNASISEVPSYTAPIAIPDEPAVVMPVQSNDPRFSPSYLTMTAV